MKNRSIAIRNVYVMMAYAFRSLQTPSAADLETEPFDHLHDLFAEILTKGVAAQVKRGLHQDYLRREERLTTVRGRIDIAGTVAARAVAPGGVVCTFDEYDPDTPLNRALKSVLVLLIRHGDVSKPRKDALRRLLPYLAPVTLVSPESIRWQEFTFNRTTATYRLLLGVCQLVVRGLLLTDETGESRLANWLSDEAMSALYERFIREYYAFHHPELTPAARTVAWDCDPESAMGDLQLPAMRTDVTLKGNGRTLIIDAKYYGTSMSSGAFGKLSVHSANLYQIFTYTKNADVQRDGSVSGLLLYARTEAPVQPDLDIVIQGNRIRARTLDLNVPWQEIRTELESLVECLQSGAARCARAARTNRPDHSAPQAPSAFEKPTPSVVVSTSQSWPPGQLSEPERLILRAGVVAEESEQQHPAHPRAPRIHQAAWTSHRLEGIPDLIR